MILLVDPNDKVFSFVHIHATSYLKPPDIKENSYKTPINKFLFRIYLQASHCSLRHSSNILKIHKSKSLINPNNTPNRLHPILLIISIIIEDVLVYEAISFVVAHLAQRLVRPG